MSNIIADIAGGKNIGMIDALQGRPNHYKAIFIADKLHFIAFVLS
jgi:hypothetical protein